MATTPASSPADHSSGRGAEVAAGRASAPASGPGSPVAGVGAVPGGDGLPANPVQHAVASEVVRIGESGDRPEDLRLRRSWWSLGAALAALGVLAALQVAVSPSTVSVIVAGLVGIVAVAVVIHGRAVRDLEHGRRREAENLARILRGLSRSVSPDAIVDAIAADLGEAAAADHTVVVRLRPEARALEATLVSSRVGVPSSTTLLPLSDLDDPGIGAVRVAGTPVAVAVGTGAEAPGVRWSSSTGRAGERPAAAVPLADLPDEWHLPPSTTPSTTVPATGPARGGRPTGPAPEMPAGGEAIVRGRARPARPFATPVVDGEAAARIVARIAGRVGTVYALRNTIAAPLRVDGAVVGAIILSRRLAEPWGQASVRLLAEAAGGASAALARAYSHRAAEARASTDALTGLPNRRYFDEFCGLLARRRRADDAVGVLMVDIDHFKRLNDRFGHPVGDAVLKAVARAIAGAVREEDVPARFGGEEFAVLLRNPSAAVALEVGERIRAAVAGLDLRDLGPERVTVSVGVAMARAADQPISDIVDHADHALYRAKRLGRDRVVAA